MGKYAGRLSTDIGTTIDELRLGVVEYTAAQTVVADVDALLRQTKQPPPMMIQLLQHSRLNRHFLDQ